MRTEFAISRLRETDEGVKEKIEQYGKYAWIYADNGIATYEWRLLTAFYMVAGISRYLAHRSKQAKGYAFTLADKGSRLR